MSIIIKVLFFILLLFKTNIIVSCNKLLVEYLFMIFLNDNQTFVRTSAIKLRLH